MSDLHASNTRERPLSPHLGIYKLQITMVLSILHRGTGIFLVMGTPLLVYWLYSVQGGETAYMAGQEILGHWFVQLMLVGWTFSMFYHLCNGIRHLGWDIGSGYEIPAFYRTGYLVVASSVVLTLVTLFLAWRAGGIL
jgi:succinate dehydrogenase / fumarate reductase cytochrome b subunit